MRPTNKNNTTNNNPDFITVTFKHEGRYGNNSSETVTYQLDPGEFAVMVETDRIERASAAGLPVEAVDPRDPQEILDELWNGEERVTHEAHRSDRGPGAKKCECGAGCGERRGCRIPNQPPFSIEVFEQYDLHPHTPNVSAEQQLMDRIDQEVYEAQLDALEVAKQVLTERQKEIVDLIYHDGGSKAKAAEELGVSRAAVTKAAEASAKKLRREVVNKTGVVGSGLTGDAPSADPETYEQGGNA